MNKFTILFCLVALAAVVVNAAEEQAPSANEYDVYNSNGDNVEDAARPKRFLLLKKKLLLGKAIALKKGVVLGGAALGGGALLAKKFGGHAPATTYHHYVESAPVHYVSAPYYDHAHYAHYDDHHHFDHHFDHHYDHHDDYHHGGYSHGW